MMTADAYRVAANKLVQLAKNLSDQFDVKIDYIDLGGGFASKNTLIGQYLPAEQVVPTMEQFADAITSEMLEFAGSPDEMPMLILETGRALIDDAGYLLSTVLATKRLSTGKRSIVIDAGVNILFTSFWYKHKILPAQETGIQTENATIYGPLCMNIDVIRDDITLPALKKDDKIVIHYVGAYEVTQWMQFISLRPNVVMIMEDKTVELIREKEELKDIVRREKLPEQLKTFKL
jgi:diaminopimelate decarboxylase